MDNVELHYLPDIRETSLCLRFTLRPLEECFDQIRELCETYPEDLRYTEFYVYTEDKKPMFCIWAGIRDYSVKEDFKHLEPKVAELCRQCFPPETEEETGENP